MSAHSAPSWSLLLKLPVVWWTGQWWIKRLNMSVGTAWDSRFKDPWFNPGFWWLSSNQASLMVWLFSAHSYSYLKHIIKQCGLFLDWDIISPVCSHACLVCHVSTLWGSKALWKNVGQGGASLASHILTAESEPEQKNTFFMRSADLSCRITNETLGVRTNW